MKSAVPPLLQPDLEQNERHRLVQLRQTPNRGNKSFPPAQFKDAADENHGWLLATDPRDPTSRYLTSRRSACRSKGRKPGDCQQDNGGIEFQLTHPGAPLRRNTSIYWSGGDHRMTTRRRDRASEDEPAKSSGRTGADPEEAKYPAQRVDTMGACPETRTSVYTRRILLSASGICPEMDAKEWLKKLEDFFRASGVPTMDYGAVGRYLQATDDSFEELKERLLNAYGLRVAGDVDRPIPCSAATRRPIHPAIRPGGGRAGRWGNVEGSLSGDPAAGTANPRGSSKAGHEDNPGGGRLPGEATAPRRRREDREDGDGPEDRRHDKGDGQPGQESGTAGTSGATAPQDRTRMLPLWQPGQPPARLLPASDPNPASAFPE
ncbi:hypothetical protein T05_4939 [Trichinella murrelli]|uniref:Uncharacterized protein n=1 Tax=Trichinella murrelli TaxID=144512 RepID=A0A0V0TQC2_9BILA|nr:hypothetical protein T05_4939 [Trichinella murrelli]